MRAVPRVRRAQAAARGFGAGARPRLRARRQCRGKERESARAAQRRAAALSPRLRAAASLARPLPRSGSARTTAPLRRPRRRPHLPDDQRDVARKGDAGARVRLERDDGLIEFQKDARELEVGEDGGLREEGGAQLLLGVAQQA